MSGTHLLSQAADGGVRCWGGGAIGVGVGGSGILSTPPTTSVIVGATQVGCGLGHSCALLVRRDGYLLARPRCKLCRSCASSMIWIYGATRLLPSPPLLFPLSPSSFPPLHYFPSSFPPSGSRWRRALLGLQQRGEGGALSLPLAVRGDNRVTVRTQGELGTGTTVQSTTPYPTSVITGVRQLAVATYHTCVLMVRDTLSFPPVTRLGV